MNEKLRPDLETDEAWDAWESFLTELPQEELVQCLLTRMSLDPKLMTYMYCAYSGKSGSSEADESIALYAGEVDQEIGSGDPDTDFLHSETERFFQNVKKMPLPADRKKAYEAVAGKLGQVLESCGDSLDNDDRWVLEDLIRDAESFMNEKGKRA